MQRALSLSLLTLSLCLVNCGGGGGGGDSPQVKPPVSHAIEYGYYLTAGSQPSETIGSVSIGFLGSPITSESELLSQAATFNNLGVKRFIVNLIGIAPSQAGPLLKRLEAFGTILAIYPVDEPNINGCDKTNLSSLRTLGYPLFTIMGPARFGWACAEYFDWIGIDDYEKGTGVLDDITNFSKGHPGIRMVLVPGGASPWRESPDPYFEYSKQHEEVVAIIPFLWHSFQDGPLGIDQNGMAVTYTNFGKQILEFNVGKRPN